MIDKAWIKVFYNRAVIYAQNYRDYLCKLRNYAENRNVAFENHIYKHYKMLAYKSKGRAEGIIHIFRCLECISNNEMNELNALLKD